MRHLFYFTVFVALTLLTLAAPGCSQKNDRPVSPVFSHEGDLIIVTNSAQPTGGKNRYQWVETLSIGNDDDPNYTFIKPGPIDMDSRGNIHVLDKKLFHIKVFTPQGAFLRNIGRQGAGPGEMLKPLDLKIDKSNDHIHVLDRGSQKLLIYDRDGVLFSELPLTAASPKSISSGNNGGFYLTSLSLRDDNRFYFTFLKYAASGILMLTSPPLYESENTLVQSGKFTISLSTPFDPGGVYAYAPNEKVYYGNTGSGYIALYNHRLSPERIIKHGAIKRVRIPQEERDAFIKDLKDAQRERGVDRQTDKIYFPDYYPVFLDMFAATDGGLWLRLPRTGRQDAFLFHRFDATGIFREEVEILPPNDIPLGKISLHYLLISDHFMTICRTAEDAPVVKRFALKRL